MAAKKFNYSNPESLIYQNQLLKLTVLGGIKLEGLDRMRSTLKIELKNSSIPPLRHNLDLYNDVQTEKLIRKAAERLEIGTSVISASLSELTEQLENYRVEQIKNKAPELPQRPTLTAAQITEAKEFLTAPLLLTRTNEMIGKSGMIGEEQNRLLMYLIFTSRKQNHPLHIVSLGASGTGKTHLQEKVGQLIPEEDRIEITTLSENAFYYFGQRELKNKLILIEDLDGADNALYPLRELQSKKRISKTVAHKNTKGETRTIHLVVEGPVSVSGCTTKEQIYEDNANRSFLIYLDESEEQDQRIMSYQRALSANTVNQEAERKVAELLQNCQRLLEPIKVVNPYAEELKIPSEVFKPRRTNNHYLQFIEVVTFYHQYQREQKADRETGEIYIETTLEDIAMANKLMKEVLLRKSDELSGACRYYFERLKGWMKEESKTAFTNNQARTALKENHSNQKRYMIQLQQMGLIRKGKGDKKKGYYYEVVSLEEYEKLKDGITDALDGVYLKLPQAVQSSLEVQKPSELLQANTVKQKTKKFTESQKV
jgi:predicted transcriptional regulator